MTAARPVLILAGGTGGHIFPGLAVAKELLARQVPVYWLGSSHGLENALVPKAGITLHSIAVQGIRGKGMLALLLAPFRLTAAVWQAIRITRRLRPRAVVSFGGFAAGPGGLAAWLLRYPLIVHEQNRRAGLTNRVLARLARRVLLGFAGALPGGEWVGNPVRAEIASLPEATRRDQHELRLLVLGGSQGARALNRVLPAALKQLADLSIDVRHQCGARLIDEARAAYAESGVVVRLDAFIDDMAAAYAESDLILARSGALTLAEICAAGVASILVPYPHAVDDHQTANADVLVQAGAAVRMAESTLAADSLATQLRSLLIDREVRQRMAQAARSLAKNDAAARVAEACLEVSA